MGMQLPAGRGLLGKLFSGGMEIKENGGEPGWGRGTKQYF